MNSFISLTEDRNFLEYPNWIITQRDQPTFQNVTICQGRGWYCMYSSTSLPVRFDKMVLYFLLQELKYIGNVKTGQVTTTRYRIAQSAVNQKSNFSKKTYDRIMDALHRWESLGLHFIDIFYKHGQFVSQDIYILDWSSLCHKTGDLTVQFNYEYVRQIQESTHFCSIDMTAYRRLQRPLSLRLYELLLSIFCMQHIWCVYPQELGQRLTLQKRGYPSQIERALQPAIAEINAETELNVSCNYDKNFAFFVLQNT